MLRKYIPAEKIEIVTEEESSGGKEKEETPFAPLQECGINVGSGLRNCAGDEAFYRSILLEYSRSAEEKKPKMRAFLEQGDLPNYGILVHSVKSTSATIGAEAASKLAQELESAAGRNDEEYIKKNHSAFEAEYDKVLLALEKVLPKESTADADFDENGVMEFTPDDE